MIGQGSIGRRHARLLAERGCEIAVVTRGDSEYPRFASIAAALAGQRPEYVVVANETFKHREALVALADGGFAGTVLVEKPLFDVVSTVPAHAFRRLAVGYNLRFHPVLAELRRRLDGRRVVSAEVYAGQWLPDWRPGSDYRASYSASANKGGGVLRDLSHELDLIGWLFGGWKRLTAIGGKRGDLAITSDDTWGVLMELESGAILTLQLSYLDRPGRRRLNVVAPDRTIAADVMAGRLIDNGETTSFELDRDETYRRQHAALLGHAAAETCTANEGLAVLATIAAIERAARECRWVENDG